MYYSVPALIRLAMLNVVKIEIGPNIAAIISHIVNESVAFNSAKFVRMNTTTPNSKI